MTGLPGQDGPAQGCQNRAGLSAQHCKEKAARTEEKGEDSQKKRQPKQGN
jgi:hypothetical protein